MMDSEEVRRRWMEDNPMPGSAFSPIYERVPQSWVPVFAKDRISVHLLGFMYAMREGRKFEMGELAEWSLKIAESMVVKP